MLVDLNLRSKRAVIVGDGEEAAFKAKKLVDGGAKVTLVGQDFADGLKKLHCSGSVELVKVPITPLDCEHLIRTIRPSVVIVALQNHDLDEKISSVARAAGALVCVVDRPELNDFNMPAIARIGDIRVGVSTDGNSPAMSRLLRERIERLIRPEDLLQVKLQGHVRKLAKKNVKDQSQRRELVYKIIRDRKINRFLSENRFEEAKVMAEKMVLSGGSSGIRR